jgi:hypothetical protein
MWEVSSQELRLTDQIIGKGSFCSVVKGIFNGAVVAVKLPHNMQAISEQVSSAVAALTFLARLFCGAGAVHAAARGGDHGQYAPPQLRVLLRRLLRARLHRSLFLEALKP